ncbi:MAG: DedA family protein [Paracoccaceae bacterium]|nr:DedA family protein [Paracoccaceae bacterium]MDE3123373.1 DedA family protein [Paracoccaceae bacterium]MDE3237622.1 DedA family protein [Paracoccaceae bacterium]
MIRRLYAWTLRQAGGRHAPAALGLISFVESSVFPVPADVIFLPMCLSRPDRAMRYAVIATVTSVLGGIFGWMLGHYAFDLIARPILESTGKLGAFEALRAAAGEQAILVMLVTSGLAHMPPIKLVTILAGVINFSLPMFIVSAIVARGARFFLLGWLLRHHGERIVAFIERRLALVTLGIGVLAGLAYLALRSFG